MDTGFLIPPPDLEPFIERFWWRRSEPGEMVPMPLLAPGVGTELFFHFGNPFQVAKTTVPSVHLLSARTSSLDLAPQKDLDLVAIRFRSGAVRHFLPMPVSKIPEGILCAESLWGHPLDQLYEQLGENQVFLHRARSLSDWCRSQFRYQPDKPMDRAQRALYEAPGCLDLDTVMEATGLGPRQFQRRFKAIMGIGPKRFQRLARFYRLVRQKALSPGSTYLPQALDLGFYDQAHVIHDFQTITGHSPREFFRELQRRTHFYNPSR